jgi:DNA end-binding protein Ku
MARAIWKGSLNFGLVSIPVEILTAVKDSRPRFRLLHKSDNAPIKYQRVCQREGTPVAWEDLVKGYEYEKGRFVTLTKDDLETAALERSRTIDILDFVVSTDIDDRFFEVPYYLVPSRGADRAYGLLREALRKTGRIGIAKYIMRTTQHLAAIEVVGDALVLTVMRFADELVDPKTLSFPEGRLATGRELDLAVKLVEGLAAEWSPERYKDDYRENLMRLIRAKLKGKKATLVDDRPRPEARVVDLMERLQKSLAASNKRSRRTSKTGRAHSKKSAHAA